MTTTTDVFHRALSDEEMARIREAIQGATGNPAVAAIVSFFQDVAGVDLSDPDGPRIDPTQYAIPEAQWKTICGWLVDANPDDPMARVNYGLDWMNAGPSAYPDAPA